MEKFSLYLFFEPADVVLTSTLSFRTKTLRCRKIKLARALASTIENGKNLSNKKTKIWKDVL